jgi:hypothetical protein
LLEIWRGGGEEKIFLDQGFFYMKERRFQKSSLLEIWGRGGGGKDSDRGFFLQGTVKRAFLGLRKNKGQKQ